MKTHSLQIAPGQKWRQESSTGLYESVALNQILVNLQPVTLEALYDLEEDSSDLEPSQHSTRKRLLGDLYITLTELLPDLEHVALVGR